MSPLEKLTFFLSRIGLKKYYENISKKSYFGISFF